MHYITLDCRCALLLAPPLHRSGHPTLQQITYDPDCGKSHDSEYCALSDDGYTYRIVTRPGVTV